MVLLLGVVVVSARYRRGPALLASLLSIAAFDFLFVPPYYTFDVHDGAYLLTFAVMLVVALTMSRLTGQILEHAAESEERARRAGAVAALNAELMEAKRSDDVLATLARHVARAVGGEACTLTPEELDGDPAAWASPARELLAGAPERVVARRAHGDGRTAGLGTTRSADADVLVVPLRTPTRQMGVVVVGPESPDRAPTPAEIATVEALAEHAALAHERAVLAEQRQQARVEAEAERLRSSLLSSLSHDFRTPLATIEGAASGLLEEDGALPPDGRRELAADILEESRRMTRLVANLLNMVRVETGALAVQKSWQPLEEVIGVALLRAGAAARRPHRRGRPAARPPAGADGRAADRAGVHQPAGERRQVHAAGTPIAVTRVARTAVRSAWKWRTAVPGCRRARRSRCSGSSTAARHAGGDGGRGRRSGLGLDHLPRRSSPRTAAASGSSAGAAAGRRSASRLPLTGPAGAGPAPRARARGPRDDRPARCCWWRTRRRCAGSFAPPCAPTATRWWRRPRCGRGWPRRPAAIPTSFCSTWAPRRRRTGRGPPGPPLGRHPHHRDLGPRAGARQGRPRSTSARTTI